MCLFTRTRKRNNSGTLIKVRWKDVSWYMGKTCQIWQDIIIDFGQCYRMDNNTFQAELLWLIQKFPTGQNYVKQHAMIVLTNRSQIRDKKRNSMTVHVIGYCTRRFLVIVKYIIPVQTNLGPFQHFPLIEGFQRIDLTCAPHFHNSDLKLFKILAKETKQSNGIFFANKVCLNKPRQMPLYRWGSAFQNHL